MSTGKQRKMVARLRDQDEARRKGGASTRRLPSDAQLLQEFQRHVETFQMRRGAVTKAYKAIADKYNVVEETVRRGMRRAKRAAVASGIEP